MSCQPLRHYQARAIRETFAAWASGAQRVLLVAPTGSGKTRLGEEIVFKAREKRYPILWIAHRRELIYQAGERLRARFGLFQVGLIARGAELNLAAPVQVATIQTLVARNVRPRAMLVVFDEAHHYVADEWAQLASDYGETKALGLTATPERTDGRNLGDMFDAMVVAELHSQLIKGGYLVRCRAYRPPSSLGGDLAQDPISAYKRYGENGKAFLFCGSIDLAHKFAAAANAEGIKAAAVEANTKARDRSEALRKFASGEVRILTNVYALTEGVDVPSARVCILARNFDHVSPYLQATGRVLRPAPGKGDAIIIDLVGATLRHGFPTEDRSYALTGEGIGRAATTPLRNCEQCGILYPSAVRACPECGFAPPEKKRPGPRVHNIELCEAFAGEDTPDAAKRESFAELLRIGTARGYAIEWAIREYRRMFRTKPDLSQVGYEEKRRQFMIYQSQQRELGYKPTYAVARFKSTFGAWPPRAWSM